MTKSLAHRHKSPSREVCHGEINLTDTEVKRGTAYRSRKRCERYYRVGDIRKAKGKHDGYSRGFKIKIVKIAYCKEARRTAITFKKVNEHKREIYFEWLRD